MYSNRFILESIRSLSISNKYQSQKISISFCYYLFSKTCSYFIRPVLNGRSRPFEGPVFLNDLKRPSEKAGLPVRPSDEDRSEL
ncbi:hypothetical protein BpHYR1_053572 [Brachionus plicatilis]|uniref:Uncharacterized protein n=1 Tax=Brachionus plicatilis TaxID=10195 RepID=A0A3M7QZE0_BRAPC|nr:hypothetical protein BpHYR1_053572 [Brachionus plicatilis]